MVNARDATKIAIDTAASVAAEVTVLPSRGKTMRHTVFENAINSTVWHYALRDTVNAYVPGYSARLGAKGASLAALRLLQSWADGSPESLASLLIYGASQAAAEVAATSFGL